jgi:hypothetical protein
MARAWNRADIRTRAQYRADMVNSSFVSTTEWNDYFNEALGEYWTIMSECAPSDFAVTETTVATTAGTLAYALPADFRALLEVYADEGNNQRRPILPVDGFSRAFYRAPDGAQSIILRYQQNAPVLADDVTTVDFGELGDGLVVRHMAQAALAKEESDISFIASEIARLEQKLRSTRQRDRANAQRIRDVDCVDVWLYPNSVRVRGYCVLGTNIELYQPIVPFP